MMNSPRNHPQSRTTRVAPSAARPVDSEAPPEASPEAARWLDTVPVVARSPLTRQLAALEIDLLHQPAQPPGEGTVVLNTDELGVLLELTPESALRLGRALHAAAPPVAARAPASVPVSDSELSSVSVPGSVPVPVPVPAESPAVPPAGASRTQSPAGGVEGPGTPEGPPLPPGPGGEPPDAA
ncbi:hypothetical protein [Mycetocola spongiae]|uniref:hypothetical protein n=1 Tax=Mycetocola spongiae TaxID=2859226 RepID=UPI001CF15117|nr:hypothetical protein [Mycetocola spongiae]UCR88007.1 hypothetical protein KXZ72_08280 [Mycetocola spongiae]